MEFWIKANGQYTERGWHDYRYIPECALVQHKESQHRDKLYEQLPKFIMY